MSDSHGRDDDPHVLFFISQNMDLEEETREQAEQGLRDLGGGSVHVPSPSNKRARDVEASEGPSESQPSKKPKPSPEQADDDGRETSKIAAAKDRPRIPVTIPSDVEIIVISDDSDNGSSSVTSAATRQRRAPRRIYHPDNHTSTSWRCPVGACRRNSPELGFKNNSYVERHIRNRHAEEFVYRCISGCSITFRDGWAWEKHHRVFHDDEMDE